MTCVDRCRLNSDIAKDFIKELNKISTDPDVRLKACRLGEKRCKLCQCKSSSIPVPSKGTLDAKVLIIDSNPGREQVAAGSELNITSAVSKLLSRILLEMGIQFQDCFITYAFHCNTKDRLPVNYDKCSLWLSYELSLLNECNTIITLGEDAFHLVMGDGYPRVKDIYGKVYRIIIQDKEYKVIPFMHPWFLLKNPEYMQITYDIARRGL